MTDAHCRWVADAEVPNGRYLIPGCWNQVVHGDGAECQCENRPETLREQVDRLEMEIMKLRNAS